MPAWLTDSPGVSPKVFHATALRLCGDFKWVFGTQSALVETVPNGHFRSEKAANSATHRELSFPYSRHDKEQPR